MSEETVATHLYLIRHGQAVVNVTQVMGGPKGDTGLTSLGKEQARRLHDRLATGEIRADVLLSSTLPRARETAEIIAPALGLPIAYEDDLQEMRVGPEADGLSAKEYIRRFGWIELEDAPFTPINPGGESWARFTLRVSETLTRIAQEHRGKAVVIVCHGGIIDASFLHFFGLNAHAYPPVRFLTRNTSITHWAYFPRKERWHWRLEVYNDINHLSGLDTTAFAPSVARVPTE